MNNFGKYITPEDAYEQHKNLAGHEEMTVERWRERARAKPQMCDVCGNCETWRMFGGDMCFTCITGESDASEDQELIHA